jgi:hypothetical protein
MRTLSKIKLSQNDIDLLLHKTIKIALIIIAMIAISEEIGNKLYIEKIAVIGIITDLLIKFIDEL